MKDGAVEGIWSPTPSVVATLEALEYETSFDQL